MALSRWWCGASAAGCFAALMISQFSQAQTDQYTRDRSLINSVTRPFPTYFTSINYPQLYGAYRYAWAPSETAGAGRGVINVLDIGLPPFPLYWARTPPVSNYPAAGEAPGLGNAAVVNVIVPADAELRFERVRAAQGGVHRRFVAPQLQAGRDCAYDLSATWTENGREVAQHRRIVVRAGREVTVDLLSLGGGAQLRTMGPLP